MSDLAKSDDSCRSGEECVSQDKCPQFLDLKEQWNSAAKGTVQYNRLLTRYMDSDGVLLIGCNHTEF